MVLHQLLEGGASPEVSSFLDSLWQSVKEGHLCWKGKAPLSLPPSLLEEGTSLFPKAPIVQTQGRYYLQKNWVYETYVIEQVRRLKNRPFEDVSCLSFDASLLPEQKEALVSLFRSPFSVLCGGPGTGKTYTAGVFVQMLASLHTLKRRYRIALTAPTGKAALHLNATLLAKGLDSARVDVSAFTLHRLLKLRPGEVKLFTPQRLDFDLVIVDEASMMDVSLFAHLLECIGPSTRLVLMGDPNQLPPVEAGGLFKEFAALFGVFLQRSMRTQESSLHKASLAILQNNPEDFFASVAWKETPDLESLIARIAPIIAPKKPDPASVIAHYAKTRVLNALRQGPFGLDAMNHAILEHMERTCRAGEWWAIPILVNANVTHLNLYNGTPGVLIGQKQGKIDLFSGVAYFAEVPVDSLPPFELSFVLSIHKSQGSEFDHVIAVIPDGSERFGKEALYTAVTRAKKTVEVIGKKEVITSLFQQQSCRVSGFADRFC